MDLTSRADAMRAAANLRKILAGEPGISTGVLGGSGAVSTQKAVDNLVPDGYVAVVDAETREFTRLPQRAFAQSVVQSDMGKGQKASMLRKAEKKDKEVFTRNKKMKKAVKQDKVKKAPFRAKKLKKADTSFKALAEGKKASKGNKKAY